MLLICVLLCMTGRSQGDSTALKNAPPRTLKKMGRNAIKQQDPFTAAWLLEQYVKKRPRDGTGYYYLGLAYMSQRDYERAQREFQRAFEAPSKPVTEGLYYAAQMQKCNGRYDSAKVSFMKFRKAYKGSDKVMKKQASREIAFCDSVMNAQVPGKKMLIVRLDNDVNKVNTEAAPLLVKPDVLVYSSLRTDHKEYVTEDDSTGGAKRKIYHARREGDAW
jgi:hypothetical protein